MRDFTVNELVDKLASVFVEKLIGRLEEKQRLLIINEVRQTAIADPKSPYPTEREQGESFLTAVELTKKLKISRSTIWRLQQEDKFPKAKKASSNRTFWLKSEIEQWMLSR